MERFSLLLAGVVGFLGVALGAFGAHGLKKWVTQFPDAEQRLTWWQTGSQYHLLHALAIGLTALHPTPTKEGSALAPWFFLGGIILFSGSLYIMTLTGRRVLGAVTPLGGLLLLAGWLAIALNALFATA
ncbi:MAG TPA: DUF423 domain-containing protein [Polyangium sp.]|nr:DUF423 domain-containing protein [Polyangium sp.]